LFAADLDKAFFLAAAAFLERTSPLLAAAFLREGSALFRVKPLVRALPPRLPPLEPISRMTWLITAKVAYFVGNDARSVNVALPAARSNAPGRAHFRNHSTRFKYTQICEAAANLNKGHSAQCCTTSETYNGRASCAAPFPTVCLGRAD
jgi:hypothetical protein